MNGKETTPRVLIIAEHASWKFGGEAALPLHYFRLLRQRGIETWLIVHERTRTELLDSFPGDKDRIYFVPDTWIHRFLSQLGQFVGDKYAYFVFGFISRLYTQFRALKIAKKILPEKKINIIHQPIPVSPKEPSFLFSLKAPVIIGPMNGGMEYPPAFKNKENVFSIFVSKLGRQFLNSLNFFIPGKREAAVLMVANARTKKALPSGLKAQIVELTENGIDLEIWKRKKTRQASASILFVYVGRLLELKGIDLLLTAFKRVCEKFPAELQIVGDGSDRKRLEQLTETLGLSSVSFLGWLPQAKCADILEEGDVFVFPSLHDCGGAAVLEAMAMGLPVIATNWGGPADYLDSTCGILIDPSSKKALIEGFAESMIKLAQDPALRSSMGEQGRHKAVSVFDWEHKLDEVLKVYQSILRGT